MEKAEFLLHVAAVVAGNMLTGLFLYFLWYGQQMEKRGEDWRKMPFGVACAGFIPPLSTAIVMAYYLS